MKAGFQTVFFKEMKDVLRDRKTLLLMIILPIVVVPLLLNLLIGFVIKKEQEAKTEVLEYVVFGDEFAPELAKTFEGANGFKKVTLGSSDELVVAIREDRIDFGLVIPEKTAAQLSGQEQASIELHFDNASMGSKVEDRVQDLVEKFNDGLTAARLAKLGRQRFLHLGGDKRGDIPAQAGDLLDQV